MHGLGWHYDNPHQYSSVPNVFILQTTRLFEIVALLRLWPQSRKEPGNSSKAGDLCLCRLMKNIHTNSSSPLKKRQTPKRKGSSSNHQFSGAVFVSGRVCVFVFSKECITNSPPSDLRLLRNHYQQGALLTGRFFPDSSAKSSWASTFQTRGIL